MFDLAAALALGYLLGSFPSAVLVARLTGKDIFSVGSGNMGAMNTARNIGWIAGMIVLLLDLAKGVTAVVLAQSMAGAGEISVGLRQALPLAAGVGAVSGHAWSAFARLRGGKALATALGVALPVYPLGGLYTVLLYVALVLLTRRSTLSSIAAMVAYPAVVMAVLARGGLDPQRAFPILTSVLLISAIVIYKHVRPSAVSQPG